ncbi:rRNA-processing protein UTP23 homolog [Ctenocephalides felis]|uniref:rRNA-processing protein UTP23 homolog n=1 Tax=Ctenocephalides felis TaxID=7515 RepID=UPI000E6E5892|nr:rRNA-processing protein UTP23 homolog [Ctenocephalides felis]
MKITRYKKVHRNLNFYINNFGFHQPFQILIDGTFCFDALKNQFNIQDQLKKYFQAELKLLTTQCVIVETENLGPKLVGAMKIVKQFGIHKCGHEKAPIGASDCLLSMVGKSNRDRYVIATQDRDLQEKIREKPGVPLLYLHRKAPCLERPSQTSRDKATENATGSFKVQTREELVIKKLKEDVGLSENNNEQKRKRRKKKGPNPLSCKKKQKKNENAQGIKKRSRNRIRLPKQMKALLQAHINSTVD